MIITAKHFKEEQDKLPAWKRSTKGFQVSLNNFPLIWQLAVVVFLKATCPVCREAIFCDVDELKTAAPPKELEKAQKFEVTQDLRLLQQKMQQLFNYQKSKGGIIDIEAEENKLLLITNSNDNTSEDPSDVSLDF